MSDYTTHTWSNGDDFDAAAANGWDGRIDNAFASHETDIGANTTNIGTNTSAISTLQAALLTIPFSPNTAAAQAGTTYTFALTDAGTALISPATGANTWTVPPNSGGGGVAFPTGTVIVVMNASATSLTIAAGSGVTIRNRSLVMTDQYTKATLHKSATNLWWFNGEVG